LKCIDRWAKVLIRCDLEANKLSGLQTALQYYYRSPKENQEVLKKNHRTIAQAYPKHWRHAFRPRGPLHGGLHRVYTFNHTWRLLQHVFCSHSPANSSAMILFILDGHRFTIKLMQAAAFEKLHFKQISSIFLMLKELKINSENY